MNKLMKTIEKKALRQDLVNLENESSERLNTLDSNFKLIAKDFSTL